MAHPNWTPLLRVGLLLLAACDAPTSGRASTSDELGFPSGSGKADAFGRSLVGLADPYPADPAMPEDGAQEELDSDPAARREQAWRTMAEVLRPVPLLGLADVDAEHDEIDWDEVPLGPRFETWYGGDELRRMIAEMLRTMSPEDRQARRVPTEEEIDALLDWNATAVERSDRWPLERYLAAVGKLDDCDDPTDVEACAVEVDGQLGGAVMGVTRVLYGPAAARHILRSWGEVIDCREQLDELDIDAEPADEDDFAACLHGEFPFGTAIAKVQWDRVGFGRTLPVFDTDAGTLAQRMNGEADWGEEGDRRADPAPGEIYAIELRDGSRYRMSGMHVMTKELRHWQWVTMWWSDTPDLDFGEDRPATFDELPAVWSRYKMCAVTAYAEQAEHGGAGLGEFESLGAALKAMVPETEAPTWCSNPYLEHGPGNAGTNCIGCHQHGGATVSADWDRDGILDPVSVATIIDDPNFPEHGRTSMRALFPSDYLWSYGVGDNLADAFATELDRVQSR